MPLYAKNNSATTISAEVVDGEVDVIEVEDTTILPPLPCLMTAYEVVDGKETNHEVMCLRTFTGGNNIQVIRAVEGTSKEWPIGTKLECRYTALYDLYENLGQCNLYRSLKDSNGIFTYISWKDPSTNELRKDSYLLGTPPTYTTRRVRYYASRDRLLAEDLFTLTFDSDGNIISEVLE